MKENCDMSHMINKDVHRDGSHHMMHLIIYIPKHMFICHVTHHLHQSPDWSCLTVLRTLSSPQECTPTGLKKLAGTSANTQSWDCAGILQGSVGDNKDLGEEGWVDSPGLVTTHVHLWVQAIIRGVGVGCHLWVAVFVFWLVVVALQSLVVIGIHGQSQRAVVVMSIVGSSDKHGWWWWEGEMVVGEREWLCLVTIIAKQTLFVTH